MPMPVKEYIAELGGWQGFTVGSCSRYDFSARDVPSLNVRYFGVGPHI
jgi:hypothetical protein